MQDSNQKQADVRSVHVREPDASHLGAIISKFRRLIRAGIDHNHRRAEERRNFRRLMQLDDRLLKDIGLTRSDLISIQLGATTLVELDAARESRRHIHSHEPVSKLTANQRGDWNETPEDATAAAAKCA